VLRVVRTERVGATSSRRLQIAQGERVSPAISRDRSTVAPVLPASIGPAGGQGRLPALEIGPPRAGGHPSRLVVVPE
jgi:hypothetical protein